MSEFIFRMLKTAAKSLTTERVINWIVTVATATLALINSACTFNTGGCSFIQ